MQKLFLILIILISKNSFSQSDNLHRFYDFGIEIDFHHGLLEDDYKIIFPNGIAKHHHLKKNTLYWINYTYGQERNRTAIDTLKIELSRGQMDTIFKLTKKQFTIRLEQNLSKYEIPLPPIVNDGMIVNLIFDLQFRGDKYMKEFGTPLLDEQFMELFEFIQHLTSKR